MKILIVGSGGREHALAWKVAQSSKVSSIYVAPGNAGTELEQNIENINIEAIDIDGLLNFAKNNSIDLTIIGPEVPLSLGIVDTFEANNLLCLGPTQKAAQLESSKAFSKDFMQKYNIPTAAYKNFTNSEQAKNYILDKKMPIVVKASGLAAGKGVVIAQNLIQANEAITDMLSGNLFGNAGCEIVIEEFLEGEEASFIVLVDGKNVVSMASSQDHKARDDGDKGPNTGGMGAYSPAPVVTPDIHVRVLRDIIQPVVDGMNAEGSPYKGFLYAGLMIDKDSNIKTLEYNCRFGDPETQPIMMRLESDFVELALAAAKGDLTSVEAPKWRDETALGVVLAAKGYPDSYPKGEVISGLDADDNVKTKIFHAGTKIVDGNVVTAGGRVLCAVALGDCIEEAYVSAYNLADNIKWKNQYKRSDIGKKAFK
ncbi:MAG: phosphoribosylamine--glycine ligase [Francisellaceae bacterium]|jgi:phosphoribosylamine--glycine ligase